MGYLKSKIYTYVGHDERSGSEPDIRPGSRVPGSQYASYRIVGVRQNQCLNSLNGPTESYTAIV